MASETEKLLDDVGSVSDLAALIERVEAHSEVTPTTALSSPVVPRPIGRELLEAREGFSSAGDGRR